MICGHCGCGGEADTTVLNLETGKETAMRHGHPDHSAGAIKIGYLAPLSGSQEVIGKAQLVGAQIAVDQINKDGGVEDLVEDIRSLRAHDRMSLLPTEQNVWFLRECTERCVVIDSGRIVFSGTRDEFDCLRSSAGPSNSGRRSRQMSITSMSQFGRASWKRLTNASAPAEDAASFRGEHLRWKSFATGSALYRLCVTREPGSRRRRW